MELRFNDARRLLHSGLSITSSARTELFSKQIVSSFVQFLDQSIGAPRGQDRGELVAPQREIADRSVEIDIDDPAAADQVIDAHGAAVRLQELGLDDFTATARFRSRLRINNEAFA